MPKRKQGELSVGSFTNSPDDIITLVAVQVDHRRAEDVARKVATMDPVLDVYMVTGDVDIMIRARFGSYKSIKGFVVNKLGHMEGVRETRTLMVVNAFKENGRLVE